MKLERSEAIILHTWAARERDKMVVFLTPDHGKRKGWAYGARGIKSRFGASLEPLAKVRIESVDLLRSLFPAQQNLTSSVAATYIAEMVDTFAQADDPAEKIYRLLDKSSEALLEGLPPMAVVTYAEIWILRLAGIFPSFRNCVHCGDALARPLRFDASGFVCENCSTREAFLVSNEVADVVKAIVRMPVAELARLGVPTQTLLEVRSLSGTVRRHFLGHELKSFEVLASVLRS